MAKKWITNNHSSELDFELEEGGFQPVKPGESVSIAIKNFDSARNQGMRHAGLYTVSDKKPGKDDTAPEPATTTRPTSG